MKSKLKLLIPVGILALVAVFLVAANFGNYLKPIPQNSLNESTTGQQEQTSTIPVVGNIEGFINQLNANADDEALLTTESDSEAGMLNADSSEINNYGQAYDENLF